MSNQLERPIIFSFCIYGTEKNYYNGLFENIEIIKSTFENHIIYIYKGICDPLWDFPEDEKIKIVETFKSGPINMLYRFLPIKTHICGFSRDTDSRISKRDIWCINQFLNNNKNFHVIRDHYYHKGKIMGGTFGWKKQIDINLNLEATDVSYGYDEYYIAKTLYPLIKDDLLVHSNIYSYVGESVDIIKIEREDIHDFVGNVIWDGKPKFEYFEGDIQTLFKILLENNGFEILVYLSDKLDIMSIEHHLRPFFIDTSYIANFYLNNIKKCQYWLSKFEFADISNHNYNNSKFLFQKMGKLVASFDSLRIPNEGEVVIVYGDYPDWYLGLPISNKIFRNVQMFFEQNHDSVEYHPAWNKIDLICILNMETRPDRLNDILCSLVKVKAPLHKVKIIKGKKDSEPYLAATHDHIKAMEFFIESGKKQCLVLEDDIKFIDDVEYLWKSISTFYDRDYNYNICFLSISKYGNRLPYDDLLSISKQPCTTSAAYLLNYKSAKTVCMTAKAGFEKMKETGDSYTNCIDRYWTRLENLFFFKQKLAFQRPNISMTTGKISINFD